MSDSAFATHFKALTGHEPLAWQERLYKTHFDKGTPPPIIDIPTGLGKTMVMAVWLIARAKLGNKIPTRLVYVVDRRTVVDQATDLVQAFAFLLNTNPTPALVNFASQRPELIERKQRFANELGKLRGNLKADLAVSTLRGQLADNREWSRDPSRPAIIIGMVDLIGSRVHKTEGAEND